MDRMILAAYNGLTCAAFAVTVLALTVLVKSYKDGDYHYVEKKPTFWTATALTGWMGSECISRAWWAAWKTGYMARDSVSWMLDHPIVLVCVTVKIMCGILFIKALTEDSPQGRLWKLCAGLIGCVVLMGIIR